MKHEEIDGIKDMKDIFIKPFDNFDPLTDFAFKYLPLRALCDFTVQILDFVSIRKFEKICSC